MVIGSILIEDQISFCILGECVYNGNWRGDNRRAEDLPSKTASQTARNRRRILVTVAHIIGVSRGWSHVEKAGVKSVHTLVLNTYHFCPCGKGRHTRVHSNGPGFCRSICSQGTEDHVGASITETSAYGDECVGDMPITAHAGGQQLLPTGIENNSHQMAEMSTLRR